MKSKKQIMATAKLILEFPEWLLKKIFRAWQIYMLMGEWMFIQLGLDQEEEGRKMMAIIRKINFIKPDDKLPFDLPNLR